MKRNKSIGVEIEKKKQKKKEYLREYYQKNKEQISKQKKEYNKKNKDKMAKQKKEYMNEYNKRSEVKKRNLERVKKYSQSPKGKLKIKSYVDKNKDGIKKRKRKWNQENKDRIYEQHQEYYEKNKAKRRKQIRKYLRQRYKENGKFKVTTNLRNRFNGALRLYSKTGKIMSARKYGIDYGKIIEHLKPFPKDMKNYEVDHIIPLSWFDFNNTKEIKWAFAPENHQWMLKKQNRMKSDKFMGVVER